MADANAPSASEGPLSSEAAARLGALAERYIEALLARERSRATDMVMGALDEDVSLEDLYLHVFQTTQYEIGRLWERGQISVGHEHYCTNVTQMLMAMLYPRLFRGPRGHRRLVAACVQGELHELGIRMLADLFTLRGWDSDYLGANTPPDAVIRMLEEVPADVLAVGVTLHTHLEQAEKLIRSIRAVPALHDLPILVGGYSLRVTESLWRQLGADGTAADAGAAIAVANALTDARRRSDQR
jgi:MerR family transcriptional regulator, light-induced transcriptional regulator